MKSIFLILFIAHLTIAFPAAEKSSEDDDWHDKVINLIKTCKTKNCTKGQTFEQLQTLVDNIMKDIKLGTLDRSGCSHDFEAIASELTKDDVINRNDLIEFFKGVEAKYQDRFMIATSTMMTTMKT